MPDLTAFIAGLPKAELHVHHVGSASPAVVADLAARYEGSTSVPTDPQQLADYFQFTDFGHFIEVYLSVVDLVRTAEDVHALTLGVGRDMAAQNIRYAELTLTPYTSIVRGIAAEAYCEAVEDARLTLEREGGPVLRWIFDIPASPGSRPPTSPATSRSGSDPTDSSASARRTGGRGAPAPVRSALRRRPRRGSPQRAARRGVHRARDGVGRPARAGGRADRPRHHGGAGSGAARPPGRARHPARDQPDVQPPDPVGALARRAPARRHRGGRVPFSVNSDDPPMFATDLGTEYAVAAGLLGLDRDGVADLARAAVRQSFLDDAGKRTLLGEIDTYVASA